LTPANWLASVIVLWLMEPEALALAVWVEAVPADEDDVALLLLELLLPQAASARLTPSTATSEAGLFIGTLLSRIRRFRMQRLVVVWLTTIDMMTIVVK
jgi:hypothetical protein